MATATSAGDPAAHLERVLNRLISEAAEHSLEVRAEQRHAVQAPVWLGVPVGHSSAACPSGQPCPCRNAPQCFRPLYKAFATNISKHGISLLTEFNLPLNVRLCVNLEALASEQLHVPMRTIYCKQLLNTTYQIGGVFVWE